MGLFLTHPTEAAVRVGAASPMWSRNLLSLTAVATSQSAQTEVMLLSSLACLLLSKIVLAFTSHLLLGKHNSLIEFYSAVFIRKPCGEKERKKHNIPGPNPGPSISEGLEPGPGISFLKASLWLFRSTKFKSSILMRGLYFSLTF